MIQFHVAGTPVPQGAVTYNKAGFGYHPNGKALKVWRKLIASEARKWITFDVNETKDLPVILTMGFIMPRGKSVTRLFPTVRPDLDHLIRAVGDALTGIAFIDDSQVVSLNGQKAYFNPLAHLDVGVVIGISYMPKTDTDDAAAQLG